MTRLECKVHTITCNKRTLGDTESVINYTAHLYLHSELQLFF